MDVANCRTSPLLLMIVLVALWGMAGATCWSGVMKGPLLLVAVTTWPAHEFWLAVSGPGAGANALTPITAGSVLSHTVWAAILWSPLGLLRWKAVPKWMAAAAQAVMLVAVFLLFWQYGNG